MANTFTFAHQTLTDANIYGGINYLADLNTTEEFSIGNTASASVSFATDRQLPLYSKDSENGTFTWEQDGTSRGRYYITEVTKEDGKYTVTAYDAMILLDTNISALSLSYPLTVSAAASAIASYIGCTVSGTIVNGTCSVSGLSEDITIRDLLSYVAEASGCSVKINGSDELCFMYYADSGVELSPSNYKRLEVADYACAAIDNVTILNSIGMTVASSGSGTNSLFIENNPFLEEATTAMAAAILAVVGSFSYIPITCELFDDADIEVGTMITLTGDNALIDEISDQLDYEQSGTVGFLSSRDRIPFLVMHIESSEEGAIISSVGSNDRSEYNKSYEVMIADASTKATKYITRVNDDGVKVHAEDNIDSNYVQIDANGMEIYKGGDSVAQYGDTARIGKADEMHFAIDPTQLKAEVDDVPILYIVPYGSLVGGTSVHLKSYTDKSETGLYYNNAASDVDATVGLNAVDKVASNRASFLTLDLSYAAMVQTILAAQQSSNSAAFVQLIADAIASNSRVVLGSTGDIVLDADTEVSGSLKVKRHTSPIGSIVSASLASNLSVANNTNTKILEFSLDAGVWIVVAGLRWDDNANGYRKLNIQTTSGASDVQMTVAPVSGESTQMIFTRILSVASNNTKYYLNGRQNSGGPLNAMAGGSNWGTYITAVRIA